MEKLPPSSLSTIAATSHETFMCSSALKTRPLRRRASTRQCPFCEIALESEFFSKQIIKDRSEIDAINSGNGFFFADIGTCRVTVHVTYTTELGSRRNAEIEQCLTDGQRH